MSSKTLTMLFPKTRSRRPKKVQTTPQLETPQMLSAYVGRLTGPDEAVRQRVITELREQEPQAIRQIAIDLARTAAGINGRAAEIARESIRELGAAASVALSDGLLTGDDNSRSACLRALSGVSETLTALQRLQLYHRCGLLVLATPGGRLTADANRLRDQLFGELRRDVGESTKTQGELLNHWSVWPTLPDDGRMEELLKGPEPGTKQTTIAQGKSQRPLPN
jgi:hypothetical protein